MTTELKKSDVPQERQGALRAGPNLGKADRLASVGQATEDLQLVNKLVTAGVLYFGAKLVIDGDLSVGELVAFNILAGLVSAPVAGRPAPPVAPRRTCR
jgi:ABC-type protease/lipase transport system fused ATPase/permease subunit